MTDSRPVEALAGGDQATEPGRPNPSGLGDWQRSSPFAVVFFAGSIARIFARGLSGALIPLVALVLILRDNPRGFIVLFSIVAGALVLFLVIAAIQWLCFKFRIEEDRLLIRKGIFRKTALDLPFERVQGINVERSLVDRILGLVTVTLDTSGSVLAEGKLPSIRTELADYLRAGVGAFRPPPRGDASDAEDGLSDSTHPGAPLVDASSQRSMLLKLGAADMIRIGLASRNFILVLAIVGLITDLLQPGDLIEPILEAIAAGVDSVANAFSGLGAFDRVVAVTAVVFTIVAGSLFLAIGAAFLRHHNFTLWGDGRTFRSRAGLLTQREVVVESARIQQLTLDQTLVLRWLGRYRLRALPAALMAPQGNQSPTGIHVAQVLDVPLLDDRLAEDLRSRMFSREAGDVSVLPGSPVFNRVSPHYVRALTLRISVVLALALGAILLGTGGTGFAGGSPTRVFVWWLLSIPVVVPIAWQIWRRRGYMHDDDGLASRSGFIGNKVDAFLLRKAQSVGLKQSPLQRRKGLATLQIHLASGKVTVPYIEHGVACRLRDYILYKVETNHRWH